MKYAITPKLSQDINEKALGLKSLAEVSSEAFEVEGNSKLTDPVIASSLDSKLPFPGTSGLENSALSSLSSVAIQSSLLNTLNPPYFTTVNANTNNGMTLALHEPSTDPTDSETCYMPPSKIPKLSTNTMIPNVQKANQSIPALRFEKIAAKEWEYKECKIYSLEALLSNSNSAFCLIDETKLSNDERQSKKLSGQNIGFTNLCAELQNRSALITSWPKTDYSHLQDFLQGWQIQDKYESLTDYWYQSAVGSEALQNIQSTSVGSGIIAYETVIQVGIIIRMNEELGITEDCWRLIYPKDLHCESLDTPFSSFLTSFFPQLRSSFSKIEDMKSVIVKYFPHEIEPPLTQAPPSESASAYQTIATLDDQIAEVLAR